MLDLRPVTTLADYFVICTGETERQVGAILEEIREKLKEAGLSPFNIEGEPDSGWVLMDYGSVVAHIFLPAQRDYYELEELWKDATMVVRIQ